MISHVAVAGHQPPSSQTASINNSATNTAVAVTIGQQQQQLSGQQQPLSGQQQPLSGQLLSGQQQQLSGQQQQLSGQQLSTHTLLQHPSDIQIKPIVGNKNIESSLEKFAFKDTSLPFVSYACDSISKHTQTELEAHLTIVYKALQKTFVVTNNNNNSQQAHIANASNQSLLQDRIRILSYLFSIAAATEVGSRYCTIDVSICRWFYLSCPSKEPAISSHPAMITHHLSHLILP